MMGDEPAFPTDSEAQIGPGSYHFPGMTKREYFAALALQGLLANSKSEPEDTIHNAIVALRNADTLINKLSE